jgi:hypothetical protein
LRSRGFFGVAGPRVARALLAFPRQLVAVVRTASARTMIGLPMALLANVAALALVVSLARAIYYPFWAAGASPGELERSWGGPSAVGATLVHWLVAAVLIVAAYLVILVVDRRAGDPLS